MHDNTDVKMINVKMINFRLEISYSNKHEEMNILVQGNKISVHMTLNSAIKEGKMKCWGNCKAVKTRPAHLDETSSGRLPQSEDLSPWLGSKTQPFCWSDCVIHRVQGKTNMPRG